MAEQAASVFLALSPHGRVYLAPAGDETASAPLGPGIARRIERAFDRGGGHGLLHLGAVEVGVDLPPSAAFFRDLGRTFMTRLCGIPDLEGLAEKVEIPRPDPAEMEATIAAAPPMIGGEYLTVDLMGRLWADMEAAFRAEAGEAGGVAAWPFAISELRKM